MLCSLRCNSVVLRTPKLDNLLRVIKHRPYQETVSFICKMKIRQQRTQLTQPVNRTSWNSCRQNSERKLLRVVIELRGKDRALSQDGRGASNVFTQCPCYQYSSCLLWVNVHSTSWDSENSKQNCYSTYVPVGTGVPTRWPLKCQLTDN
jgi:hypothetical protein